ncbi:hypothetical protein BS47DRAFT_1382897 [Hydnum rufescens UP504]|uniref:Uncharacterized protein n=1 Tax=Hydnum rufescens UP504 TaxID=1448309 RepID=A0A9P6DVB2_9AGAM|nr:hypothetical protein BS47DRAFT_1382897 [Hydnum rufescens UP504]
MRRRRAGDPPHPRKAGVWDMVGPLPPGVSLDSNNPPPSPPFPGPKWCKSGANSAGLRAGAVCVARTLLELGKGPGPYIRDNRANTNDYESGNETWVPQYPDE